MANTTYDPSAGSISNYYDSSVGGGEGGQVYVYPDGSTVSLDPKTNNIYSATRPVSDYQATASDMWRVKPDLPQTTTINGQEVGYLDPIYVGQNNQMSFGENGEPTTMRVQPNLSNFDKVMRATTIALAAAPWAYGAATGFAGASSAGGGLGAAGTVGGTAGTLGGSTASTLPSTSWVAPQIGGTAGTTGSTFGTLNAALPAAGSVGGAGAMSAALPTGAVIGTGANGGAIGGTYLAGANGMVATDALGSAIPASSVGIDGFAPSTSSFGIKDAYNAYKTANALRGMFGKGSNVNPTGSYGTGTTNNWNYQNQPFLKTPQQSSVYAPTGLNVSGVASPDLDVSRSGNLLANLLRR